MALHAASVLTRIPEESRDTQIHQMSARSLRIMPANSIHFLNGSHLVKIFSQTNLYFPQQYYFFTHSKYKIFPWRKTVLDETFWLLKNLQNSELLKSHLKIHWNQRHTPSNTILRHNSKYLVI